MEAESTCSPASGILKAWWARIGIKRMFRFFDEVGANAQFTRELETARPRSIPISGSSAALLVSRGVRRPACGPARDRATPAD